jgi:hypothetical protein
MRWISATDVSTAQTFPPPTAIACRSPELVKELRERPLSGSMRVIFAASLSRTQSPSSAKTSMSALCRSEIGRTFDVSGSTR